MFLVVVALHSLIIVARFPPSCRLDRCDCDFGSCYRAHNLRCVCVCVWVRVLVLLRIFRAIVMFGGSDNVRKKKFKCWRLR